MLWHWWASCKGLKDLGRLSMALDVDLLGHIRLLCRPLRFPRKHAQQEHQLIDLALSYPACLGDWVLGIATATGDLFSHGREHG